MLKRTKTLVYIFALFLIGLAILNFRSFLEKWFVAEVLLFKKTLMHFKGAFQHFGELHVIGLYFFSVYGLVHFVYKLTKVEWGSVLRYLQNKAKAFLSDIKNDWRQYILVLLVCILTSIVSVELFLRIVGWDDTYSEANGDGGYNSPFNDSGVHGFYWVWEPSEKQVMNKKEFKNVFFANSLGLFDLEWTVKKAQGKKRLFCIGDSFTQGVGSSNDSTYPRILQRIIGDSFDVCNAGVSGSDPFFGYVLLRDKLLKYKPDEVLVTMNTSDVYDVITRGGFERFLSDSAVQFKNGPWWEFFFAKSYIVRFIARKCGLDFLFMTKERKQKETQIAVEKINECFKNMNSLCYTNKITFRVIFHPMRDEVLSKKLTYIQVLEYCNNNGISTINALPAFVNLEVNTFNIDSLFWPIDCHYKNTGYNVMAKEISKELLRQK